MIEIVNYSPKYEKQHFEFATKLFGKRRKRRNPDYIYWKFRGEFQKEMTSLKLAIEHNKVIGQVGLIPCSLKIDNSSIDAQWICDIMVDPDFRGKGVANQLYEAAHRQKPITLGSDPSPAATKSMLRAGYKKLESSSKQFIPVYLGVPLQMKGMPYKLLKSVKNPFLSVYGQKKYQNEFKELDIVKENHHELFRMKSDNDLRIYVNDRFKEWRFQRFKDYYPGVRLYNLSNTRTFFSGYYHGSIYFITDLELEEASHFYSIINFILNLIPKKIDRIRFQNNINSSKLGSKLTTIEYSTKTSIIYYTEDKALADLINDRYFYYTFQDSDENI
ncbi:GNAT family N-acetyltransferase [Psychroflexus sp. CAK8W]|uniref:GNAT family N-acetyltransferase n=1 Tax=Psychroflexus longus TaxID=2873596 RepID=A0ABS7XKY8_9FLAO|nr:GNAT family N-acetyltransferase [Psychroflexus longus]MBZ9779425.1 GNAT family N-acetyltransferase [Psychroflexus longus]